LRYVEIKRAINCQSYKADKTLVYNLTLRDFKNFIYFIS